MLAVEKALGIVLQEALVLPSEPMKSEKALGLVLAEAAKANLEFNPGTGEELEKNVRELLKLDPPLVNKLKEILK